MPGRRARALWAIGDQGLASASNFLLLFLTVRASSTEDIGAFGLAYTTYFLIQAMARAVASEPFTIRYSAATSIERNYQADRALGVVLLLFTPVALLVAAVGLTFGGPIGTAFVAMAALLPMLLLQDTVRLIYFANGRPQSACLNDLLFLVAQVAIYVAMTFAGVLDAVTLFLGWGVAATLASAASLIKEGWKPRLRQTRQWLHDHRDLAPASAGDNLVSRGADQLTSVITSAVAGLGAVGSVTSARLIFAPFNTLQTGIYAFALPELSRLNSADRRVEFLRLVHLVAFGTAAVLLVGTLGALAIPTWLGENLLDTQWRVAKALIAEAGSFYVVNALANGFSVGLRGLGRMREMLMIRIAFSFIMLGLTAIGAHLSSASGALWGMTLGTVGLALAFFVQMRKSLRVHDDRDEVDEVSSS